jgi:hypothetical protein
MQTNFDDPLQVRCDGRTIIVTGRIRWDPGDDHCRISVVLTQGNLRATCNTGNYTPPDDTWECQGQLPSGQQWDLTKTVHCVGTATPPPSAPWPPQDVSLEHQPAAAPA